jgi:hypothetical protein
VRQLPELIHRNMISRPVSTNRSASCRLRAARKNSTTSSGSGNVRFDAFDFGVPVTI